MKIRIRQANPFPTPMIILSVLLIFIAPLAWNQSIFVSLAMLLIGIMGISAYQGLDIDLKNKIYNNFLWIAGYKKGENLPFREIEYFLLTKASYTQTVHSIVAKKLIRGTQYRALIRFSKDLKIILWESTNKGKLLKKLKKYATKTGSPLLDLTGKAPKWIE